MSEKYFLEKIHAFTQSNTKDDSDVAHIQACIEGLIHFFDTELALSNDPTLIAKLMHTIMIAKEFDEYLDGASHQKDKMVAYYAILECQYRHVTH